MKPEEFLKRADHYLRELQDAKRLIVKVGLPEGAGVYPNGASILEVGASHEFGAQYGERVLPMRSFLRVPFRIHQKDLQAIIDKGMASLLKGGTARNGLGLLGVKALNISSGAFTTRGYGEWPDNKPATKRRKDKKAGKAGSKQQVLVDDGLLVGAITFEVTDAKA